MLRVMPHTSGLCASLKACLLIVAGACAADVTAIKVSPNGHYFLDGNGSPFLYFGDTQWDIWQEVTVDGARAIIDDRASKGFNEFNVMIVGTSDGRTVNKHGQRPFLNNNPSTPNDAYFQTADSVVHMCRRAGIVVVVGIHHSNFWGEIITQQNAYAYAKWLGTRYRNDPNIVWCPTYAGGLQGTMLNLLITGLKDGDGGTHLMTRHPDPYALHAAEYAPWQDSSWLAFQSMQTYHEDQYISALVRGMYALTPVKPAVEAEAWYEADGGCTPYNCRQQVWWTYLSGGFYTYGHTDNWQNVTNYAVWLDAPGNLQVVKARDLIAALDWWNLVPDQTVISGNANSNSAARSSTGAWAVVYLPFAGAVTINMAKITAAPTTEASWYNPVDGTSTTIGNYATSGTRTFTAPTGWQDAALMLRTGATTAGQVARSRRGSVVRGQHPSLWVQPGAGVILRGIDRRYNLRGECLRDPR